MIEGQKFTETDKGICMAEMDGLPQCCYCEHDLDVVPGQEYKILVYDDSNNERRIGFFCSEDCRHTFKQATDKL